MEHNTDDPMAPKTRLEQDKVAKKAYAIYVKKGRPQGCDKQNWLEAEA